MNRLRSRSSEEPQHLLALPLQHGVVEGAVRGAQLDPHLLLLLGGQVGGDELLRAPQHERADAAAQPREPRRRDTRRPPGFSGTLPFSMGPTYSSRNRRAEANRPGSSEREQRPQLGEAVLERRAGDGEDDVGVRSVARPGTPWWLFLTNCATSRIGPAHATAVNSASSRRRRVRRTMPRGGSHPSSWSPLRAGRVDDRDAQVGHEARRLAPPRRERPDVGATTRNGRPPAVSRACAMSASAAASCRGLRRRPGCRPAGDTATERPASRSRPAGTGGGPPAARRWSVERRTPSASRGASHAARHATAGLRPRQRDPRTPAHRAA